MEIIKPFVEAREKMSLIASNKKYWSRIGDVKIWASKDVRDPYTGFMIHKLSYNQIALTSDTGKYVSLIGGDRQLWASKTNIDDWCRFTVYDVGNGQIALQGRDGRFVSRIGETGLQGTKEGIDDHCKFTPAYATFVDPKFKILGIEMGEMLNKISYEPCAVSKVPYTNGSSEPGEFWIKVNFEQEETQTTTWENSWGFNISIEYECGVPDVIESSFGMSVGYESFRGGSKSTTKTTSFERWVFVKIAPKKTTTATLVVKRCKDAKIPFTATIQRRDCDGFTQVFKQKGEWSGALYTSAEVIVEEEN